MKKIISKILLIIFSFSMFFSISACDDGISFECKHNFEWITAMPARCGYGESNASWQICIKCNAEGESWIGPVLEHEWELVSEVETCKHCGKTKESFLSEAISQFNDKFNGEFKLAESMPSDEDIYDTFIEGFRLEMGFGCYLLYSDNGLTHYIIGGFPDCLDEYTVTHFSTVDSKYTIFGFSIGSSPVAAENILAQRGYELSEEYFTTGSAAYVLGKIKIMFSWNCDGGGPIENIHVALDITNLDGVIF